MAEWDRLSIHQYSKDPLKLMESAALVCKKELLENPIFFSKQKVLIVCGPGNNGGDGFALAHLLELEGISVEVFFTGKYEKLSQEAQYFYDLVQVSIHSLHQNKDLNFFKKTLKTVHWIVDAVFGIGLNRKVSPFFQRIFSYINQSVASKLAVDIPSGVHGDFGTVMGSAVKADLTVTFELPKFGQLMPEAWDYVGDLKVYPIGLSASLGRKISSDLEYIDLLAFKKKYSAILKKKSLASHKGSFGKLLVLAGSSKMPGAGYLTCLSALRMGVGKVVWGVPSHVFKRADFSQPEIIFEEFLQHRDFFSSPLNQKTIHWINSFDAVAIGPGLGQERATQEFLFTLLKKLNIPCVLDADALNLIAKDGSFLSFLKGMILTPHPQELARITCYEKKDIIERRQELAKSFAKQNDVWVLAKGYRSNIVGPKGKIWINSTGGSSLAIPGSGDVLTGMIAGLLAQGINQEKSLIIATYLHGAIGDNWKKEKNNDRGMLASEIAHAIPKILKKLLEEKF